MRMESSSEQQEVRVANTQRFAQRHEHVDAHDSRARAGFDSAQVAAAQTGACLDFFVGPAVRLTNQFELLGDVPAQVSHVATLVTDDCQDKSADCSVAAICKSCEENLASTACVFPVTRERRRAVCGRVLCEDCKVRVEGEGFYCRAHALVVGATR